MGRHNREGRGTDQRGYEHRINYQPDWLRLVKVTRPHRRRAGHGRRREASPGERVRTRIVSPGQGLDMEVAVSDPRHFVSRVQITCMVPTSDGGAQEVVYTLEDDLPAASRG